MSTLRRMENGERWKAAIKSERMEIPQNHTLKQQIDALRAISRHRYSIAKMNGCDPEELKDFCRDWILSMRDSLFVFADL